MIDFYVASRELDTKKNLFKRGAFLLYVSIGGVQKVFENKEFFSRG